MVICVTTVVKEKHLSCLSYWEIWPEVIVELKKCRGAAVITGVLWNRSHRSTLSKRLFIIFISALHTLEKVVGLRKQNLIYCYEKQIDRNQTLLFLWRWGMFQGHDTSDFISSANQCPDQKLTNCWCLDTSTHILPIG